MASLGQALPVNPQKPGRAETENVPNTFSRPSARHGKCLPERGENVLMTGDSALTLIGRQQALFIIQR